MRLGMMSKSLFTSSVLAFCTWQGLARADSPEIERINIDIPTKDMKPAELNKIVETISDYIAEGKSKVAMAEVVTRLNIEGDFKKTMEQILASREELADLECQGRSCKLISLGDELTFRIEKVDLPILGVPTVQLSPEIAIHFAISEDLEHFEACQVEGIKVKTGFLNNRFDGFLIEQAADEIKTFKVDAGAGGDYPDVSCKF